MLSALLVTVLLFAGNGLGFPIESQLSLSTISDVEPLSKTECDPRKRRKSTLKLLKELPFIGLFSDLKNQSIFEASGLANVEEKFYAIFDSSYSIGLLDEGFHFRDAENKLIGEKGEEDSEFEGIAYVPENKTFLLLQETVEHDDGYRPHIIHAQLHKDMEGYEIVQDCTMDFKMSHSNKGFESIQYVRNEKGAYLLGMCEGNHCVGGSKGKDSGNGRIVVAQLGYNDDGSCVWRPERVIKVPRSAYFTDYSALAFRGSKVAVLSQENAAVWIGDFDKEKMEFTSCGQVFHFPRDNHCETIYCNLEGFQFVDDRRVMVTSDKAKRYQPYYCDAKDQTVHIFSLPATFDFYSKPNDGFDVEKCEPESL